MKIIEFPIKKEVKIFQFPTYNELLKKEKNFI